MPGRDDEVRRTQRATKDEARRGGIGEPAGGAELPATDATGDTGSSFVGVGEPATPEDRPDERDDSAGRAPG